MIMRKNKYAIKKIPKGEDTPCKECDVYLDNGYCSGKCQLIRHWKYIPTSYLMPDGRYIKYHNIEGYIYKHK